MRCRTVVREIIDTARLAHALLSAWNHEQSDRRAEHLSDTGAMSSPHQPATEQRTYLSRFASRRPLYETSQQRSLEWLAAAHCAAEGARSDAERDAFAVRIKKVIDRCACGTAAIGSRGHVVPDVGRTNWDDAAIYDLHRHPRGMGTAARSRFFQEQVTAYFQQEYAEEAIAPSDLIHVTCTGYVAPSGAQRIVAERGWGASTRVTHAYHMGCYAAVPAVRLAMGNLRVPAPRDTQASQRVDIVHTELCSLHLDPSDHAIEQLVVQSLFADGLIRYSVDSREPQSGALEILALSERVIPDSADAMSWMLSDAGMAMTLARDVPERIGAALRGFVTDLYGQAELDAHVELPRSIFAVHPGGPRIIDGVRERLELSQAQVQVSRDVLFAFGNMSSATLPHIWMRLLESADVSVGTLILSLAFGPGLTMCGALFRKC
jgi:predicted naringenin-chalcone synthase